MSALEIRRSPRQWASPVLRRGVERCGSGRDALLPEGRSAENGKESHYFSAGTEEIFFCKHCFQACLRKIEHAMFLLDTFEEFKWTYFYEFRYNRN